MRRTEYLLLTDVILPEIKKVECVVSYLSDGQYRMMGGTQNQYNDAVAHNAC